MVIAVNMVLGTSRLDERTNFLQESFFKLAEKYPQDQFIYIVDKPVENITAKNILVVITDAPSSKTLLWQYWLNYKLPSILKKHKADILVNAGVCSLRTKIPQLLLLNDLSFLHIPQFVNKSHVRFYKKMMPKFLAKAKQVATVSQFSKQETIDRYKIEEAKIDVVYSGASKKVKPIDWKEKEDIKERYTEGKEYFLYAGDINPSKNLLNLLKAFSHFKKWQKSNMQLVIAGTIAPGYEKFTEDLKTYKYRNEVVMIDAASEEELEKITAAAYALVYPASFENFATPALQAMQANVSVIISNTGVMPELFEDAALYIDPDDFKDMAAQMMLLFKDENKRNELVEKGKQQAEKYSWDKTSELLWQAVLQCKS